MVHTDIRLEALKKNILSSLVQTTDQGVPGTGTLEMGRGPLGSSLIGCGTCCTCCCTGAGSWKVAVTGAEVVAMATLGGSSVASETGVAESDSSMF